VSCSVKEKPSPQVRISARDLRDIIRDELYAMQSRPDTDLQNELIKEAAKTIVKRALLSPR
jgi:hypothetical protein